MNRFTRLPYFLTSGPYSFDDARHACADGRPVVCAVCKSPIIFALTGKDARLYGVHPGIHCPQGHVSIKVVLNPIPGQIWDPDDPSLDVTAELGETKDH